MVRREFAFVDICAIHFQFIVSCERNVAYFAPKEKKVLQYFLSLKIRRLVRATLNMARVFVETV